MSEIKQEAQYKSLSGVGGSNQQEQPHSSSPVVQDMDKSHPKDNDITQSTLCCPSTLSCILGTMFPCSWCCGCTTLDVNTEAVLTNFGKFMGVMRQPGCYCYNGCGTSFHYVSLKKEVLDLKAVKVADGRGNPVHLSGIATYQIVDSRRAIIDVQNPRNFVETQGLTVLKQIASQYPYEGKPGQHSLRSEQGRLKEDLVRELQKRVADAGIKVLSFEFTDMAYAPEIAKDMLIRQQAEAKLDARKVIAEGAVEIATTAMQHLAQKGVRMSEADQARIVGQLLISLTSEGGVQPTMTVSGDQH